MEISKYKVQIYKENQLRADTTICKGTHSQYYPNLEESAKYMIFSQISYCICQMLINETANQFLKVSHK